MKKLLPLILTLLLALSLCACGGKANDPAPEPSVEPAVTGNTTTDTPPEAPAEAASIDRVTLDSQDAVLAFLAGKWSFCDQSKGADWAALTIGADGSCSFKRLSDGAEAAGEFSLKRMFAEQSGVADYYKLVLHDRSDGFFTGESGSESMGQYYFASFDGEDYLYLREIGNGVSAVATEIFGCADWTSDLRSYRPEWVLHRASAYAGAAAPRASDSFTAWIWKQDDGALWVQPMRDYTREAQTEFTYRNYEAAYFLPQQLGATHYSFSDSVETWRLLSAWRFDDRDYPLLMAHVQTDATGRVTEIEELDEAEYGIYDLGTLLQKYSYEGTDLIYNGIRYGVTGYYATDAILNCTEAGDWIVAECHINPNMGMYLFFNKGCGDFVYEIYGTNLTWLGDDVTTAVYLYYNEVRTFAGDYVGTVEEGQAYELKLSDDGKTAIVSCRKVEDGTESDFTVEFELPENRDAAMYAYGEYLLHPCASKWRAFMELVPENAVAYTMINPPSYILSYVSCDRADQDEADDVVVAALREGTAVRLDKGEYDLNTFAWNSTERGTAQELAKGRCLRFTMTVPEGLPYCAVGAEADGLAGIWPVTVLSGEAPVRGCFITAGKD